MRILCASSLFVPSLLLAQQQDPPPAAPQEPPPVVQQPVEPPPPDTTPLSDTTPVFDTTPPPEARLTLPPTTTPSTVRGAFGADFASQYFFRGIVQENQGLILQPWVKLGYRLYDGNEALHDVDLMFGSWNSVHDGPTGGSNGNWYESDFYVDLAARSGERFAFAARYTAYTNPNNFFRNYADANPGLPQRGFRAVEELSLTLDFDDRALLVDGLRSGLQPHATVAFELNGQRDNGNDRGVYAEIGVAPWIALDDENGAGLRLSFPVKAGFSLFGYYESQNQAAGGDELFGFLDMAAALSSPLSWLPKGMGPWHGEAALHWILLGNNLEQRNNDDTGALFFTVGASTSF